MAQILLELNSYEQIELTQWLQKNAVDCSLRSMYDNYIPLTQNELCGIEGKITTELFLFLRSKYESRLKSNIRFI